MKIRHKQSGVVLEGQFLRMGECHGKARSFFVPSGSCRNSSSQYSMDEWEEVKPQWVDVGDKMLGIMHHLPDGLRLRKVRMYLNAEDSGQWLKGRDAFIVEQRQS